MNWARLPASWRCTIGNFECDVWPTHGGARYSVLNTETGRYLAGGKCASVEWAQQVSAGFARSLVDLAGAKPCA